uniref:Tetraspanin n=1 Tax=Marmota marmota marmota TaxID=9994 RepID=A0A8C5YSL5_MARMA
MAGANPCVKYSMFIFNFVFLLCGILILSIAIWIRASKDGQGAISSGDNGAHSHSSVNMLIAVGAITIVMSFLGCYGALKENRCMLLLFFIGLFPILLMQLTAGILAAKFKPETERALKATLHESAQLLSNNEEGRKFQKTMVTLQKEFKCCGLISGAADWGRNFEEAYESCKCSSPSDSCITYTGRYVYKQTCEPVIRASVSNHLDIVIGLSFGLAAVEVLGTVFSMILFCQIEKR